MITDQARHSIEQIFMQAASSRLRSCSDAQIEIVQVDAYRHRDMTLPHVLVLTISSMTFRLLFVLHYAEDDATREQYAFADASRDLAEVLMERVNLCCGSMNQQLGAHFPDLGMSTPYALSSRCIEFLGELKPDHVWGYELRAGKSARLGVTMCVCAKALVDFVSGEVQIQEEGELELF